MSSLKKTLELTVLKSCKNPKLTGFDTRHYYFIMHKYDQVLAGSYDNGDIETTNEICSETTENSVLELRIFNEGANIFLKKTGNTLKAYEPILKKDIVNKGLEMAEVEKIEIDTKFTGGNFDKLVKTKVYDYDRDYDDENKSTYLAYVKFEYLERLQKDKKGGKHNGR